MPEGQVHWTSLQPREPEEPPEPKFSSELEYLDWLWQQRDKPDRLRFMAAAEVARYRHATMRAIAHVPSTTTAKSIEAARMRAAPYAKVVKLVEDQRERKLPQHNNNPSQSGLLALRLRCSPLLSRYLGNRFNAPATLLRACLGW